MIMMIDGKSSIVDFHRSGGECYASFMIASILVVGPSDGDPVLLKGNIGRALSISESETARPILHYYYYYKSANPKPSGHTAYTQRVCSHTMGPLT